MEKKQYELCLEVLRRFHKAGILRNIILVGSWCVYFYKDYFAGVHYIPTIRTRDIDFLVPLAPKIKKKVNIPNLLKDLGFLVDFRGSKGYIRLAHPALIVEFLIPERGRDFINPPIVKQLSLKAIPLRFADILLEEPIYVKEKGIKVLIPNPTAFCLHKLLIANRRRKPEKKIKDLEQAIHTYKIVPKKRMKQIYTKFPKPWRKRIVQCLEKEKRNLPLLKRDINKMIITLQKIEKDSL